MTNRLITQTKLFNERLKYIKKKSPWYTPANSKLLNILSSDKPLTALELGSRSFLISNNVNTNSNVGYKPVKPLKGDPVSHSEFTFGYGQLGWYFMYGNQGDTAFTFMLFRVDIAPPVVNKSELKPSEVALYGIVAGCGKVNGPWFTLQQTIVEGNYSYNSETGEILFNAITDSTNHLNNCSFTSEGFNKGYNISMEWGNNKFNLLNLSDSVNNIIINAKLIPQIQATYNSPDGCVGCISGLGSPYWSYTRMKTIASVGDLTMRGFKEGTGWFDHQWIESGLVNNVFLQLILNRFQSQNYNSATRWIWLNMQLDNGTNYMLVQFLTKPPNINDMIEFTIANKYDNNGVVYSLPNITAKVIEIKIINNIKFPSKYLITFPTNEKFILKSNFGSGIVIMPSGALNMEVPGTLFDITETRQLGNCFLEANQFQTDEELNAVVAKSSGISNSDALLFLNNKRSKLVGAISLILLFVFIIILILLVLLILRLLRKKKN
jgi:hypothetical protein